jgi:hypothetical protein
LHSRALELPGFTISSSTAAFPLSPLPSLPLVIRATAVTEQPSEPRRLRFGPYFGILRLRFDEPLSIPEGRSMGKCPCIRGGGGGGGGGGGFLRRHLAEKDDMARHSCVIVCTSIRRNRSSSPVDRRRHGVVPALRRRSLNFSVKRPSWSCNHTSAVQNPRRASVRCVRSAQEEPESLSGNRFSAPPWTRPTVYPRVFCEETKCARAGLEPARLAA